MKLEELLQFKPRANGLVIKAKQKVLKSKIVMADGSDMTTETTDFTIVSLPDNATDLQVGDSVFPTGAAFTPLAVSDCPKDEAYFYCPEQFIKMYRRNV